MCKQTNAFVLLAAASVGLVACATVSVTDPLSSGGSRRPGSTLSTATALAPASDARNPGEAPAGAPAASGPIAAVPAVDLLAIGFASISAQGGSDLAQRRLQAARAAKLDAYRNLAEQLYGIGFASESFVEDGRVRVDVIRARVAGAIHGAELVSIEPLGSDSYQATVRLLATKPASFP